ncbi:MAG TPA: GNAT family N-acetyltransferase [Polyangia bacterium]|jgi:ribosomal protein S18 acetylase RimI-like enzyme|nr:GNAT family N-acetyltransferase [Polyangia bacterium]
MEPWRSLGYEAERLGAWLERVTATHRVLVAEEAAGSGEGEGAGAATIQGLVVVQPEVLLGDFVSLLGVRAAAAGRGVGRALMAAVAEETFATRRWLYVSHDAKNGAAAGFYQALGFVRVGRLPDLVTEGRTEILLRKGRGGG